MKKKILLSLGLCAAVFALFIAVFMLYRNFAFGNNPEITLNALQSAAFPIFGAVAASAVCLRFVLPFFVKKNEKSEEEKGLLRRYSDIAAWLLLSLSLSSLAASPLAGTPDYIGYAALFGVFAALFAFFPLFPLLHRFAEKEERPLCFYLCTAAGLLLSAVFGIGIYAAMSGIIYSVSAFRRELFSKGICLLLLAANFLSLLAGVISSFSFVYLLMIK